MSFMVHPAVAVVAKTEELWEADKARARERATLIVCRLIERGFLTGTVHFPSGTPLDPNRPS